VTVNATLKFPTPIYPKQFIQKINYRDNLHTYMRKTNTDKRKKVSINMRETNTQKLKVHHTIWVSPKSCFS
jgi:hypothetical protein